MRCGEESSQMASWLLLTTACISSVRHIPTPTASGQVRKTKAPEIIEWTLRSELICMNQDWSSCEAALNRLLYYAPKDPFVLLRAAEHAVEMKQYASGTRYLSQLIPILVVQNRISTPEIQLRIQKIEENLNR